MATKKQQSKVVFEIDVLDEETRQQVMKCIEKRGKITLSIVSKGGPKRLGKGTAEFNQIID